MKRILFFIFCTSIITSFSQEKEHHTSKFHGLIENKGQWDTAVFFQSKSLEQTIWVQENGFIYDIRDYSDLEKAHIYPKEMQNIDPTHFKQQLVGIEFMGSNKVSKISKEKRSTHYYNYFIGNEAKEWTSDVHSFNEVTFENWYENIDLKLFDHENSFKYELWCKPNTDYSKIQLKIKGCQKITIDGKGNLVLETSLGKILEEKPVAYYLLNGKLTNVDCSFALLNDVVSFKVGSFPKNATLVIDPTLIFATYCGSVTDNFGMTATYGYDGTAYSAGVIYGNQYPTPDNLAFNVTSNFTVANVANSVTTDAFISKYSADGTTMLWTSFLGGGNNTQGTETSHSLICDKQNNIYIFGATSSTDFPTPNGFQQVHGGGSNLSVAFNGSNFGAQGTDIYVAKLSANGHNLLGATYVGGSANDGVNYLLSSGSYNSVAAYDSLTTNYGDQFRGEIMLDSVGNCMVTSTTRSTNFPVLNAFQPSLAGQEDAVVFKLNAGLTNLMWSSYYGGTKNDAGYSVKIDSSQHILLSGGTSSVDLTNTSGAYQSNYQGGKADGFVLKLTPNGQTITRATYLGTSNYDQAFFVDIDRADNIFVYGQSIGGTFPILNATGNANSGQFICKLTPDLVSLQNSMLFGNGNANINISPSAFLVDICGNMYVSGWGANILQSVPLSGMPVTSNAFQTVPANGFDFYLAVFDRDFDGQLYGSYLGGNAAQEHVDGGTSRFDKNGVVYQSVCGGCGGNSDFPTTPNAWSDQNLSTNCNNLLFKFDFDLLPEAQFSTDQLIGCEDFIVQLENISPPSDSYLWDFGNGDTTSIVYSPIITLTEPGQYDVYLYVTDSICLLTDTAKITLTVLPELSLSVSNDTLLCNPVLMQFQTNSNGTANQFLWSTSTSFLDTLNNFPSDSTLTITPTETTTYYVQVSNGYCSLVDSVTATFVGGSLEITGNDSICSGSSTNLSASIVIPGITFSYLWSEDSVITTILTSANVTANPQTTQYVYCTASASNGCVSTDSMLIHVGNINGNVTATATPDVLIPGSTTVLTATPSGYSYQWFPIQGVSNPNAQTTNATVNFSTEYEVFVTDGICVDSAKVRVDVLSFLCDRTYVYVPNAFSPNGDNENDVLKVRSQVATEVLLRIYNRWGELVFETKNQEIGWDGTFRGKLLDPDTYDYYLEAECVLGEKKIIKGNITLLR